MHPYNHGAILPYLYTLHLYTSIQKKDLKRLDATLQKALQKIDKLEAELNTVRKAQHFQQSGMGLYSCNR